MGPIVQTETLASDELEVVLVPTLGARVDSIRAFGELVTHSPDDLYAHSLEPAHWGGFHMVPWCNRLDPGDFDVAGRALELGPNSPDGSAIHGFHVDQPWEPAGHATFLAEGGGHDHWPWAYAATVTYAVAGPTLTIRYVLSNLSDSPMPGGVGFHPWFRVPTRMQIPSEWVFPSNTAIGPLPEPVAGRLDLRQPGRLQPGVDACWTALDPAAVTLWWDALGVSLTYSGSRSDDGPVVAVAANQPEVGGVAVELQTHAAQGIRRLLNGEPYPLDLIAPASALRLDLALTFSRS